MNTARLIEKTIRNRLFKGKVIIIYGPRQVGKTTLAREIAQDFDDLYLNADEPDIRDNLTNQTSTALKNLIGDKKLVIIDEAQRVKNIGITLKLLVDNYPETQIVATGSSSFELANDIIEPLTGRKYEFHLYPFSSEELIQETNLVVERRLLEQRLIYGFYPEVVKASDDLKKETIKALSSSYLYKDILNFYALRNSDNLRKLLQCLALQIGSEVSYTELASMIKIDKNTVAKYIELLEQAFVIFRLRPLHKNRRNEIKKLNKIYFYDNGIRNALINNFNKLDLRSDVGVLWENFLVAERVKYNAYNNFSPNQYFWRDNNKAEIDYIEERDGGLEAYEFKWSKKKLKTSSSFIKNYPEANIQLINQDNYLEFLLNPKD